MDWYRTFAVWMMLIVTESVHGIIRQRLIAPEIGDLPSRQLGVFTGSLIIFVLSLLMSSWMNLRTLAGQLQAGFLWVILTVLFEFGLGMVLGYLPERLLSDYDILQGGYMAFGLLFMLFAPALAARIRGLRFARSS